MKRAVLVYFALAGLLSAVTILLAKHYGWWEPGDDSTAIPPIAAADATDLATRLARAEAAHGICYGWELRSGAAPGDDPISEGSSRGAGTSARECARHAIIVATITYTAASSESEDSASAYVVGSAAGRGQVSPADMARVGVDQPALLADPAAATGMGALALPLLLSEANADDPLPAADEPTPAAAPVPPIARGGSDFQATHGGPLIILGGFAAAAALFLIIGLVVGRNRGDER